MMPPLRDLLIAESPGPFLWRDCQPGKIHGH